MDLINKISVENFQSVKSLEVSLGTRNGKGGLTLVVGPSSTGKSAFLRAIKLLAHNSTSVPVRVGEKKTNVLVSYDSGESVGIERGKSLSTYTIGDDNYQKAGTSVPKDVEKKLNFYRDAHFSFQFDSPYLLSEPGSSITRVFGEITNSHVLSEAVREGVRKKQEATALSRTRFSDAVEARERLKTFKGLETRQKALMVIDRLLETLLGWETEIQELSRLVARHDRVEAEQKTLTLKAPADVSDLVESARQYLKEAEELQALATLMSRKKKEYSETVQKAQEFKEEIENIANSRQALLQEMGKCPTCGRDLNEQAVPRHTH